MRQPSLMLAVAKCPLMGLLLVINASHPCG
jgi:hypothetical protein